MEITPMIIFIWKIFMGAKLCQFIYNIGMTKPSVSKILTDMFSLVMLVSMILFGFEIISEIPTWSDFTRLGQYILLTIMWTIVFALTSVLNQAIKPYRD